MNSSIDPALAAASRRARQLLLEAVPIASVSARGENLDEGARHFERVLAAAGLRTAIWESAGAPVVFATRAAPPGRPTVLFYGHYDVQPAEPLGAWESPPFTPTLRDGAVFGRGAGDNKGQLLAHVAAVAELVAREELGIGVTFLIEGEEEIGSPHIGTVAAEHKAELAADLAVTADAPVHDDGRPVVIFGVRGLLYLEIELDGAPHDLHSGNRGGIAPTPAWTLIQALATLRDAAGHVTLPGFYDTVREPDVAERAMLEALPVDAAHLTAELGEAGAAPWLRTSPWEALGFLPNCNIAGLTAGYQGPGTKTVIPSTASAKIDFRLVADQDPDAIYAAVRRQLLQVDPAIKVRCTASVPPSATSPSTPLASALIQAVESATGVEPLLRPRLGGTTPDYVFTRILGMPSILVPYGPPDMNHHAPNEKMTLVALNRGVACSLAICRRLAQRGTPD
jgi:acetylornithine deacetylase/succinyl-diaminopimelate desuccinylase-like protein